MPCWNGLSADQQRRLIEWGNLPLGFVPSGPCTSGAEVAIETEHDKAPGPRFYCRACAIEYLTAHDVATPEMESALERIDPLHLPPNTGVGK
jgi:hypothetical protein